MKRHEAASSISVRCKGKRKVDAITNVVRRGKWLKSVKQLSVIEGKGSHIASIIYKACPNLQVEHHCLSQSVLAHYVLRAGSGCAKLALMLLSAHHPDLLCMGSGSHQVPLIPYGGQTVL